jgi:hypothetical protein
MRVRCCSATSKGSCSMILAASRSDHRGPAAVTVERRAVIISGDDECISRQRSGALLLAVVEGMRGNDEMFIYPDRAKDRPCQGQIIRRNPAVVEPSTNERTDSESRPSTFSPFLGHPLGVGPERDLAARPAGAHSLAQWRLQPRVDTVPPQAEDEDGGARHAPSLRTARTPRAGPSPPRGRGSRTGHESRGHGPRPSDRSPRPAPTPSAGSRLLPHPAWPPA